MERGSVPLTKYVKGGKGISMGAKECIASGKAVLGIEFGSTRIKAVLVDENNKPIASGAHMAGLE